MIRWLDDGKAFEARWRSENETPPATRAVVADGIKVPDAGGRIHPHFGVFAPIRREYVDLVSATPLPALCATCSVAFDIGTGTGVLAAVLARRGIKRLAATDLDPRAVACASEVRVGRALRKG